MADKRSSVPVFILLCAIISFSSCNLIKENRDNCPCRLEIRLTDTRGALSHVLVTAGEESWNYNCESDTVICVYVPRGKASITAWSGAGDPVDGAFLCPSGDGFPPLYLCHCSVDAIGDEVIALARLRKQFCTLRIGVEGPPGWGRPFGTTVRGAVGGMGIDGLPLEGGLNCILGDSTNNWSIRIPRQHPDSPLLLDIVMADSVVRTFSLGSYLREAGFDWSAPDLGDLDLLLSLSVTSLTVHSPDWEPEITLTVDI